MTDDQLIKTIRIAVKDEATQAVKDEVRPLKEQVEIVKSKVDKFDFFQSFATSQIRTVKEQLSVVNEKLDKLETLEEELQVVRKIVMKRIYPSVMEIQLGIKAYGDMYKLNNDNAKKLDHRLKVVEQKSNIKPDPEFALAEVS